MPTDELDTPLGQKPPPKRKRFALAMPAPVWFVIAALAALPVAIVGLGFFRHNPLGGEPIATATLPAERPAAAPRAQAPAASGTTQQAGPAAEAKPESNPDDRAEAKSEPKSEPKPGTRAVTIIDGSSGKRQEVLVPGGDGAATRPAAGGAEFRPQTYAAPQLLEPARYGLIPRIGPDGARPSEVYARPMPAADKNAPRIALVITGLGVGTAATNDAITRLPGAVTLAFTPYGNDLPGAIGKARNAGHEVLLQVPLEPFDYPDNDPGPQTLLTGLPPDQNMDRLAWHMSRIQGYVGLSNYLGARFMANEAALAPLMQEAHKRGLAWFDDGTANRSMAGQIAQGQNQPFAKGDITLDTTPTATEIERAFGRLEAMARERGLAVGVASALPVAIEQLAALAKSAESRGIILIPISQVMTRPRSS